MAVTQVTVSEAQRRLPELLSAVAAGESVAIRGEDGQTFILTAGTVEPAVNPDWQGYPHAGSAKGLIQVPDDFDAPLDDLKEYLDATIKT